MTKGFVTIATGQERYFILARNLFYSYQQFASQKVPFAIICDKENEYTEEFDDVILLEKAHCNYLDKLQLYNNLPYDETIFIDADSLAYGNLDEWWDIFGRGYDFSMFGYAWTDLNSGQGWFVPSGVKEYQNSISFIPSFNGGMYYLRRSECCQKVFERANYFAEHYHEYQFNGFRNAADEPVLALAMAIENCKPLDIFEKGLVFAPQRRNVKLDISVPKAYYYRTESDRYNISLVHWGNYKTTQAWYKCEVGKLLSMNNSIDNIPGFLYKTDIMYYILKPMDSIIFIRRCIRKLKNMLC